MLVKKPTLRQLTAHLRQLHTDWGHPDAGGEYAILVCTEDNWYTICPGDQARFSVGIVAGREWIPGDGKKFDAIAAARRLLASVKDMENDEA
jgi:hypothetical protein